MTAETAEAPIFRDSEADLRHRASYENLLRGYASGTVAGVRDWILHVAQAAVDGAEASPVARTAVTGG